MEKKLYRNLSLIDFVQRLLTKRCAAFVGQLDAYLLLSGEEGCGDNYTKVGTSKEKEPLIFENCLSYDEIKLSVFLSVSSFTELINDGSRHNCGVIEEDLSKIEHEGVVIDITGARFQRADVMEYQDILITPQQNSEKNGYGSRETKQNTGMWSNLTEEVLPSLMGRQGVRYLTERRRLWSEFYEDSSFLFSDITKDNPRFGLVLAHGSQVFFDKQVMKKRYALSMDTLLVEAQSRACAANKQAFVHVVGIGLGTWRIAEQQTQIFLETFMQRVKVLLPILNNIGVLYFSWFGVSDSGSLRHNGWIASDSHPLGGIRTCVGKRSPAKKLQGQGYEDMLLIISYAGDGNALPGNEFWFHHLDGSNDSSTACSTLITELHNPFINTQWVCGENLHIACLDKGIVHVSEFARNFNKEM